MNPILGAALEMQEDASTAARLRALLDDGRQAFLNRCAFPRSVRVQVSRRTFSIALPRASSSTSLSR